MWYCLLLTLVSVAPDHLPQQGGFLGPGVFLPATQSPQPAWKVCLWGFLLNRSSGKGKKQPSLHYTAAQLLEKGVLVEIEDLPVSQYVSLGTFHVSGEGHGWNEALSARRWFGRREELAKGEVGHLQAERRPWDAFLL